jgi:hypothetical protein
MARPERYATTPPLTVEPDFPGVRLAQGPVYQAFMILRLGFVVVPLVAGLDKFTQLLVNWQQYLAPRIADLMAMAPPTIMSAVGGIEIAAGILVAAKPSIGGWVVAAWLWGIIINLLLIPGYYDIALRDFGLSLGAIALALLARRFERA